MGTTVAEELFLYVGRDASFDIPQFFPQTILERPDQRLSTLSGGEQVLLALLCGTQSRVSALGVDTALEQLDANRRELLLDYLLDYVSNGASCALIDNRLPTEWNPNATRILKQGKGSFPLQIRDIADELRPIVAPEIVIHDLTFSYPRSETVFESVCLRLYGGNTYRFRGPNGAGKSTLLKIVCGVLAVNKNAIKVDGQPYDPYRSGNQLFALAMQNSDDQWVAPTFLTDFSVKQGASHGALFGQKTVPTQSLISRFCGVKEATEHLLDLPKALRKRLSWCWPLSGTMPWIALDEPTLGQDHTATHQLADALNGFAEAGYGVVFVSHDDAFCSLVRHDTVVFGNKSLALQQVH